MGIHADDVVSVVQDALKVTEMCPTQSQVRCCPRPLADGETPTNTWQNRDGRIEFDCVGRDWFRAFRVTVEAFPVAEFDEGDCSTTEWLIVEPSADSSAAIAQERPSILGEPVHPVEDAEELLWRVAAFLERDWTRFARRNLSARIRKALAGGNWREELTDEDVERYGI